MHRSLSETGRSAIRPYLKTQRDKLWLGGAVSVGPAIAQLAKEIVHAGEADI